MVALLPRELHESHRRSSTAQWTALGRTLELARGDGSRIVTDYYAPVFLAGAGRAVAGSLRRVAPALHRVERLAAAGVAASALCRHAFIDAALVDAVPAAVQVLVLGAGYDSRAYRFSEELGERRVYEVDLAPLSSRKAAVVQRNKALFGHASVERIVIDFRRQSLADQVRTSTFATGAPTFVVWEGVSMYLSAAAVHGTLTALSQLCGTGSVLAMDFWQHVPARRPYATARQLGERTLRLIGEPLDLCVDTGDVDAVLGAHDFAVVDRADAAELTARHATGGRRCDPGLHVVTARLG